MTNYPIDIFYDDTDAVGIVYHANFIKYMERARTVLFQEKGLSLPTLIDKFQIQFLVKSLEIQYVRPVRLLQKIFVATRVSSHSKTSLIFDQNIFFDPTDTDTMICSGKIKIVCTNMNLRPCPIPEPILRELYSEN